MKKLFAVALLLATLFAVSATAFADDSNMPHPAQPIKGIEGPDVE